MLSQTSLALGKKPSVIREIFEYGNARKKEIGEENVFDFSLGNPSVPAPKQVKEALISLLEKTPAAALHAYTSAPGDMAVRERIASSLSQKGETPMEKGLIYMTCGAAASLTISLHALIEAGDEVIIFAPFFPEYRVFIEKAGAKPVIVLSRDGDFQIDEAALEKAVTKKTKAVIVNSPNNPTGAVLNRDSIQKLASVLRKKQEEFGTTIFLISDEPYRELVFTRDALPFLPDFYENTLVCYSFSKSLSLPGERIGYIAVSPKAKEAGEVFAAICGAGRALGFVCAPALFQKMLLECLDLTSDIKVYRENRDLLLTELEKLGFEVCPPDGAFYLFVKSPLESAADFCEEAKKEELLLVPSDDFGVEGYVRISYCVSPEMLKRSIPAFHRLSARCKKIIRRKENDKT